MNETSNGRFLQTVYNTIYALYIASVTFPCIAGIETPDDIQTNIIVLTVIQSKMNKYTINHNSCINGRF
jgi:hypothetical protein